MDALLAYLIGFSTGAILVALAVGIAWCRQRRLERQRVARLDAALGSSAIGSFAEPWHGSFVCRAW